jgi:hypothetical protein
VVVIVCEVLGKGKNGRLKNFFSKENRDNQILLAGSIGQEIPKKLNSI